MNEHMVLAMRGAPDHEQKELRKQWRVPKVRFCEWRELNCYRSPTKKRMARDELLQKPDEEANGRELNCYK